MKIFGYNFVPALESSNDENDFLLWALFISGIKNHKIDYSVINRIETLKNSIAGKTDSTNRKSGQCSASNNPVPKTSEIIWILVSGFVALAALLSRCGVIV